MLLLKAIAVFVFGAAAIVLILLIPMPLKPVIPGYVSTELSIFVAVMAFLLGWAMAKQRR